VPTAFSAAVSACRFEQGDILYAERSAYDDWEAGPPGRWIQVLDPPRSARARNADADAGRFGSSWGAPVTLEVGLEPGAVGKACTTTQGRLFTCLWKADIEALETGTAPPPPLLLSDLQRSLEAALLSMRAILLGGAGGGSTSGAGGRAGATSPEALLFMAGVDLASDASLAKAEAIWTALAARHVLRVYDAAPAECGMADGAAYHPSLVVRGIAIESADGSPAREGPVTEALKAALYNPNPRSPSPSGAGADAESADESEAAAPARADRFSLARHGWLGPLVAESPSAG
jgi:hypothetical protein